MGRSVSYPTGSVVAFRLLDDGEDEDLGQDSSHKRQCDSEGEEGQHIARSPQSDRTRDGLDQGRILHRLAILRQEIPQHDRHQSSQDAGDQHRTQNAEIRDQYGSKGWPDNGSKTEAGSDKGDLALTLGGFGAVGDIGLRRCVYL